MLEKSLEMGHGMSVVQPNLGWNLQKIKTKKGSLRKKKTEDPIKLKELFWDEIGFTSEEVEREEEREPHHLQHFSVAE